MFHRLIIFLWIVVSFTHSADIIVNSTLSLIDSAPSDSRIFIEAGLYDWQHFTLSNVDNIYGAAWTGALFSGMSLLKEISGKFIKKEA